MKWTIVLTGIECDVATIMTLRSKLMSVATIPNDGTMTMQSWLFDDYWRVPAPFSPRSYTGDSRLIETVTT